MYKLKVLEVAEEQGIRKYREAVPNTLLNGAPYEFVMEVTGLS
jgi:hypothetical protein